MRNNELNLLLFLFQTEGKQCPSESLFPIKENKLIRLAQKNKAIPFLFHFLNCDNCQKKLTKPTIKKLSDYQKFASLWPVLYKKEKKKLVNFCHTKKIKAVLIKDFTPYKKMDFHQKYLMGTDLDILIRKRDISKIETFLKTQGYQLKEHLVLKDKNKNIYYQEKNYTHPDKNLSIDLHPQLAIPHQDEFNFLSKSKIKKLSRKILKNAAPFQPESLPVPDKEYFLLALIVHYLGSDLLKGLRSLYDIAKFSSVYEKELDWKDFLKLTQKYKITNWASFTIILGSNIFSLSPPKEFLNRFKPPLKVKYLSFCWPPEKIAYFPRTRQWKFKGKKTMKLFDEFFFLNLILADKQIWSRIIRPKILFFLLKIGVNRVYCLARQKFLLLIAVQHQSRKEKAK